LCHIYFNRSSFEEIHFSYRITNFYGMKFGFTTF